MWTPEQIKKVRDWLRSEEGKKKISEITQPESEIDRLTRNGNEILWWHRIKDKPFNI